MIPSQHQQQLQHGYDYVNQGFPGASKLQQSQLQEFQAQPQQGYVQQFNNSPLANTAMLSTGYNNLNLSTRAQAGYPTPRSNGSPSLNFASLYSNRARLAASKGFEVEDDMEFCPEIPQSQSYTHHKFNPYTTTSFSPTVSPTSQPAVTSSPKSLPTSATSDEFSSTASPKGITPRAKKVLEIVNPVTGMRIGSPNPYK